MTKKWKFNDTSGRYRSHGEEILHPEAGLVGKVFPAGSEILSEITSEVVENSEEIEEVLDEIQ